MTRCGMRPWGWNMKGDDSWIASRFKHNPQGHWRHLRFGILRTRIHCAKNRRMLSFGGCIKSQHSNFFNSGGEIFSLINLRHFSKIPEVPSLTLTSLPAGRPNHPLREQSKCSWYRASFGIEGVVHLSVCLSITSISDVAHRCHIWMRQNILKGFLKMTPLKIEFFCGVFFIKKTICFGAHNT